MPDIEDREQPQELHRIDIKRHYDGTTFPVDDSVAREEPLEVRLNGITLAFLMRLPGDDKLLAAGFCLSEGLIKERGQIELLRHCGDAGGTDTRPEQANGNLVEITAKVTGDQDRFTEARIVRTGCGGADLEKEIDVSGITVEGGPVFSPEVILAMPDRLLAGQDIFRESGGTHGAGVFDSSGRMIVVKEDVGRHNAVDKVLGYLLLSDETAADKGLILSGRLSYEMVLKAARAGIPMLCSVSAPTDLGVSVGRATGLTLVGFLRGSGFNIYSHPWRVGGA
jgi:FdhD protein